MTNKDEIAELKARVAELERAAKPPDPFVPKPYRQFDPTAGMSMPRSTLMEMAAAVPDRMIKDIERDNQAPTGRPGMIPSSQVSGPGGGVTGSGTGWVAPNPLSPPPGVNILDKIMDHEDAKDRAELIEREARLRAMQKAVKP